MTLDTPIITGIIICYRGIMGIIGSIFMMMLFTIIYEVLCRSKYPQMHKVVNGLVQVGKSTLEIYILQSIFVSSYGATIVKKITGILGKNPFTYNINLLDVFMAPLISAISIYLIYLMKIYVCKIPYVGDIIFGIRLVNSNKR